MLHTLSTFKNHSHFKVYYLRFQGQTQSTGLPIPDRAEPHPTPPRPNLFWWGPPKQYCLRGPFSGPRVQYFRQTPRLPNPDSYTPDSCRLGFQVTRCTLPSKLDRGLNTRFPRSSAKADKLGTGGGDVGGRPVLNTSYPTLGQALVPGGPFGAPHPKHIP